MTAIYIDNEYKPKKSFARTLLVLLLIAVIVTGVIFLAATLFFPNNNDGRYRVVELTDVSVEKPSDYSKSKLYLNENGTFSVEIIYYNRNTKKDERQFSGIGTYTKTNDPEGNNSYHFIYIDAYTPTGTGGAMIQDPTYINPLDQDYRGPIYYQILKKNKIRFTAGGKRFVFGK